MISVGVISQVKKEMAKEKERLANSIKYQIEKKTELEQIIREAEDAKKELDRLEDKLRENMYQYLRLV